MLYTHDIGLLNKGWEESYHTREE